MRIHVKTASNSSASRYLLIAALHLSYDADKVEGVYRSNKYQSSKALDDFPPALHTDLQIALSKLFPTETQVNIYVGTTNTAQPSHYLSINRPDASSLWSVPNRCIRTVKGDLSRPGIVVSWGSSKILPSADKCAMLPLKYEPVVAGKSHLTMSHTFRYDASRAIDLCNLLQRKSQHRLTVWGNPGKAVFDYEPSEDGLYNLKERAMRYGGNPPTERFPVYVTGSATPHITGPRHGSPCQIAYVFNNQKPLDSDVPPQFEYILEAALGSAIHSACGLVAPDLYSETFISTDDFGFAVFAQGYRPSDRSYAFYVLKVERRPKGIPMYMYNADSQKWSPNDVAIGEIIQFGIHNPATSAWIDSLFTLLDVDDAIEYAEGLGIELTEQEKKAWAKSRR
jgi:hypothetical protein